MRAEMLKMGWFFLLGFTVGGIAAQISYAHTHTQKEIPTDSSKVCHVVMHADSDGCKFWSCEKNE